MNRIIINMNHKTNNNHNNKINKSYKIVTCFIPKECSVVAKDFLPHKIWII